MIAARAEAQRVAEVAGLAAQRLDELLAAPPSRQRGSPAVAAGDAAVAITDGERLERPAAGADDQRLPRLAASA